eukprot:scaffold34634_cov171-Amphora_coffeaeformis.AAC.9
MRRSACCLHGLTSTTPYHHHHNIRWFTLTLPYSQTHVSVRQHPRRAIRDSFVKGTFWAFNS